ncbi:hypothetical protein AgCh_018015 [Apium graveolens]
MAPKKKQSKIQFEEGVKADEVVDKVSDEVVDKVSDEQEIETQPENLDSEEATQATVTTSETTKKRYGSARGVSAMYKVVVKKAQGKKAKVGCNARGVPMGNTRQETFRVPKELQKGLLQSAAAKWRNFMANLTKYFVKPNIGQKKKLRKPPKQYAYVGKEAWKKFVAARNTSAWKQKKGNLPTDEEPDRAVMWHKARKGKDDEEVDPKLVEIGQRIETLLELQSKGEFIPSGSDDVLTTALQTPEHSGRVRGVGGFVPPSIFFNLPNGKRCRLTKAELLALDRERDAELEKTRKEMEKIREKIAELKAMLSAAKISSPMVSDKAIGTLENKVAFGLLFDDEDMNKSVHGVPIQPGCAHVSVDGPIQGQAKIPTPVVGEIETVDQAVGSHVSWPRDLIIFPNAPTAKSKRKGKQPVNELQKVQSLFEKIEINKNVPKRFRLLYKHATAFMKSTGKSIQIPCDTEVFGVMKTIFILHENIAHLLEFKMIGQGAICTYMAAVIAFNIQAGRGNKAPSIKYIPGCPKQPGGTECGYVVMYYMKEIVMDPEMSFMKKWAAKNRKVICSRDELDEVRFQTLDYIESFL